jgi:hypothetical protein
MRTGNDVLRAITDLTRYMVNGGGPFPVPPAQVSLLPVDPLRLYLGIVLTVVPAVTVRVAVLNGGTMDYPLVNVGDTVELYLEKHKLLVQGAVDLIGTAPGAFVSFNFTTYRGGS